MSQAISAGRPAKSKRIARVGRLGASERRAITARIAQARNAQGLSGPSIAKKAKKAAVQAKPAAPVVASAKGKDSVWAGRRSEAKDWDPAEAERRGGIGVQVDPGWDQLKRPGIQEAYLSEAFAQSGGPTK
jgi:hypothetical protein